MPAVSERYDRMARDYVRYWEPVLAETALRLLDYCARDVHRAIESAAERGNGRARLLDVGTGAGSLALEALRRWPEIEVYGVDASRGMLEMARGRARRESSEGSRLSLLPGPAERLPLEDESVDICVSSFVYQLVPDRDRALREALRVLRPGAPLGLVTWLDMDDEADVFAPGKAVDELLDELGIDPPDDSDEDVSGDFPSAADAARELRDAGFVAVSARVESLDYRWEPDAYLEYKLEYAERQLLSTLDRRAAARLWRQASERLRNLEKADFEWRSPVVFAFGRRPHDITG